MKTGILKSNIQKEKYYHLYEKYIESFNLLYNKHNINKNMLLYNITRKQIPIIYRNLYKKYVFYTSDDEIIENINIIIIGLSESMMHDIEYIIEIEDVKKKYVTIANIAVSVIGKGNKIKWEKYNYDR